MNLLRKIESRNTIINEYSYMLQNELACSNCYFQVNQMKQWLADKRISFYEILDNGFVLLEHREEYSKLYFYCQDFEWMKDFALLKEESINKTVVVEVVAKGDQNPYNLSEILPVNKIKHYTRFRKNQIYTDEMAQVAYEEPSYCINTDATVIEQMIRDTFESIGDEIPTHTEILRFINRRNIICIRKEKDESDLEGYIIFEDKGKTSYIRNVCVINHSRGKGIGKRLLNMYFGIHKDYKSFTLWCNDENVFAQKLYESAGYDNESLFNTIFIC